MSHSTSNDSTTTISEQISHKIDCIAGYLVGPAPYQHEINDTVADVRKLDPTLGDATIRARIDYSIGTRGSAGQRFYGDEKRVAMLDAVLPE